MEKSPREAESKLAEKSARIAALDNLGTIASRLHKDAISANIDQNAISDVISLVH